MNELEKAVVDELEAAESFEDFFIKVSIFQTKSKAETRSINFSAELPRLKEVYQS